MSFKKDWTALVKRVSAKEKRTRSKIFRVVDWFGRNVSYKSSLGHTSLEDTLNAGLGDSKELALLLAYTLSQVGVPEEDIRVESVLLSQNGMETDVVRFKGMYLCPIYGILTSYPLIKQ